MQNPNLQNTLIYLGMGYKATGYYDKAIDCVERCIEIRNELDIATDKASLFLLENLADYYEARDGNNKISLIVRKEIALRLSNESQVVKI